jgi:hypothetical protein
MSTQEEIMVLLKTYVNTHNNVDEKTNEIITQESLRTVCKQHVFSKKGEELTTAYLQYENTHGVDPRALARNEPILSGLMQKDADTIFACISCGTTSTKIACIKCSSVICMSPCTICCAICTNAEFPTQCGNCNYPFSITSILKQTSKKMKYPNGKVCCSFAGSCVCCSNYRGETQCGNCKRPQDFTREGVAALTSNITAALLDSEDDTLVNPSNKQPISAGPAYFKSLSTHLCEGKGITGVLPSLQQVNIVPGRSRHTVLNICEDTTRASLRFIPNPSMHPKLMSSFNNQRSLATLWMEGERAISLTKYINKFLPSSMEIPTRECFEWESPHSHHGSRFHQSGTETETETETEKKAAYTLGVHFIPTEITYKHQVSGSLLAGGDIRMATLPERTPYFNAILELAWNILLHVHNNIVIDGERDEYLTRMDELLSGDNMDSLLYPSDLMADPAWVRFGADKSARDDIDFPLKHASLRFVDKHTTETDSFLIRVDKNMFVDIYCNAHAIEWGGNTSSVLLSDLACPPGKKIMTSSFPNTLSTATGDVGEVILSKKQTASLCNCKLWDIAGCSGVDVKQALLAYHDPPDIPRSGARAGMSKNDRYVCISPTSNAMYADSPISKWLTSNFFSCVTKFTESPTMPLLPEYKMYKSSIDLIVGAAQSERSTDEITQRKGMVDHGVYSRQVGVNKLVPSGSIGEVLFTGWKDEPIKLRLMSDVAGGGLCKEIQEAQAMLPLSSTGNKSVQSTGKDKYNTSRIDIPKDIYGPWVSETFDRRLVVSSTGKRYIKLDAAVEFAYLASTRARQGAAHSNRVVVRIYPNRACRAGTWGTIGTNIKQNANIVDILNTTHKKQGMSNTNVYDAWGNIGESDPLLRELCRDKFKALFDVGITHHPLVRVPDNQAQNYIHDLLNRSYLNL